MTLLRGLLLLCLATGASAQKAPSKPSATSASAATSITPDALDGSWRYEIELPDGGRPFGTFVFKATDGRVRGRAIAFAEVPIDTVALDGDRLRLVFTPLGDAAVTVEATVGRDRMWGTFSGLDPETAQPVTFPFSAHHTD